MIQIAPNPFPLLLLVSAFALSMLSARIGRRIPAPGAFGAAWILGLTSLWSVVDALLHLLPGYEYLFTQLGYIPTVLSGFGLLVVALDYRSRLHVLTPLRVGLLLVVPVLTIVFAFTNDSHHLVWLDFKFERLDGLVFHRLIYGRWFPVHVGYQYILNSVASGLLLRSVVRTASVHRNQTVLVVSAILIPWFANLVYLLGIGPVAGLDLTSAAFSVSCVLLTAGILRYQLFDLVPVAHDMVIQQMRDAVIIFDPEGRVLDLNPSARRIFDAGPDCIGRIPSFVVSTPDGQRLLGALESPSSMEVWVESSWFDLTISPLKFGNSRLEGRTVVMRDITARRQEQEELRAALLRVETLAGDAQAANRAKSEFLAAMSHEIRTPMNAVLGASDLLADTHLNVRQREFNELIRSAGTTLLSIINDILDLSKAEAGRIETEREPFPVLDVVDQVLELVEQSAHRKGIALVLDVEEHFSPWARGDGSRFRQVLLNLMSNAVKFTSAGSVEVRIRAGSAGGPTRFEVEDTGIGVPLEAQPQLFEVFRQADASMTRRYGGTGLGLAIARRLVELMGGTIGFRSQPGQGSLFWFELPLQPCQPSEFHDRTFAGRHAAIVASPVTQRLLLNRLRGLGLLTRTFESEHAALAQAPEGALRFVERDRRVEVWLREGGSVTLDLPVRVSQLVLRLQSLLPDEGAAGSGTQPEADLSGTRVLLAEDNAVNAHLARSLLQKLGMQVSVAHNGSNAVAAFALERYDLVLMDLQMPEMDGLEAARRIRGLERSQQAPRTPIVALTANVFSSEREECRSAGMDDFVAKPVERGELQRVVMRWVAGERTVN